MRTDRIKTATMSRTAWISLLCAAFLLVVGASSVFAYVIIGGGNSEPPEAALDTFVPGKVEMEVTSVQENGEYVFTVRNKDNISAYVRVALVFNWVAADGTVYYEAPKTGYTDYLRGDGASYGDSYDWADGVDGYFYYPAPVAAGSDILARLVVKDPVTAGVDTAPEGYTFSVTAIAEGIQAKGVDSNQVPAIESVWKDNNGSGTAVATIGDGGILTIRKAS